MVKLFSQGSLRGSIEITSGSRHGLPSERGSLQNYLAPAPPTPEVILDVSSPLLFLQETYLKETHKTSPSKGNLGLTRGWFPKGWLWRIFPRNETRNKVTFGCSPGTKTGTRVRSHAPPERKRERGHIRQNHPFKKPPFHLPVK